MLTYLTSRWFESSEFEYQLIHTLRAGQWYSNPYDLPPSGYYKVYKQQGAQLVLVARGTDPHDYDNTFWYVRNSILKKKSTARS